MVNLSGKTEKKNGDAVDGKVKRCIKTCLDRTIIVSFV